MADTVWSEYHSEEASSEEARRVGARLDREHTPRGLLSSVLGRVKLGWQMLRDPAFTLSKKTKLLLVLTVLYVVSPIDIIPDILLPFGIVDDLSLLAVLFNMLRGEIDRYESESQGAVPRPGDAAAE